MPWPDASALSRVRDAPTSFRPGQEETLIGNGFSYSSARLGGSDARSNSFSIKFLWLPPRVNRVVEVFNRDRSKNDKKTPGRGSFGPAVVPIGAKGRRGTGPS
jgi:hypothetical protein